VIFTQLAHLLLLASAYIVMIPIADPEVIFIDKNLERSRGEIHVARLLLLASVPINNCHDYSCGC
jgi:hypothetical protein